MERTPRNEAWQYVQIPLAENAEAFKGEFAAIDLSEGATQGQVVPVSDDEDLLMIGNFDETKVGDGTSDVRVRLPREIWVDAWDNADSNSVEASDIGQICYAESARAVSMDSSGKSPAGRVWRILGGKVFVESALNLGPQGLQGPQGDPG